MAAMNSAVLIAGGGTGGHITPGIAIYGELAALGVRTLFVTTYRDKRFPFLSEVSTEDLFFYRGPSLTMNPFKLPLFVFGFFTSLVRAARLIKKLNVSLVMGMGGYTSAPALLAGLLMGKKLVLCEQNSVPGKVTRLFEKKTLAVYTTFDETRRFLVNQDAIVCAGNPVRDTSIRLLDRNRAKKKYNLSHCKYVILVIGGSQGSLGVNRAIRDVRLKHPSIFNDVGLIWITGPYSFNKFKEDLRNDIDTGSIYITKFVDDVAWPYRAADIAISRSGAGVMAELAATGTPSILIPFPYATNDHQTLNAQSYEKQGAAIMLKEDSALSGNLAQTLMTLLGNKSLLKRMSSRSLKAARPHAGITIARHVISLLEEQN